MTKSMYDRCDTKASFRRTAFGSARDAFESGTGRDGSGEARVVTTMRDPQKRWPDAAPAATEILVALEQERAANVRGRR
jgi:hypothetical protein